MEKFRLAAHTIHLTYKGHFDNARLLEFIKQLCGDLSWYSIVSETGHNASADGETGGDDDRNYPHTHAAFKAKKKISTRNCRYFDFDGIHPNIAVVKSLLHATRIFDDYHAKQEGAPRLRSDTGPRTTEAIIDAIRGADTLWEACEAAEVSFKTVNDVKAIRDDIKRKAPYQHQYPDAEWTLSVTWSRCLYIYGPTCTGKTQWAVHQFSNPFVVSQLDGLRDFNDSYDGIVFDDVDFRTLARTEVIFLCDWDEERHIHCRYHDSVIPRHTPKIFCSNLSFQENFPYDLDGAGAGAIRRRFSRIVHVRAPTFKRRLPAAVETTVGPMEGFVPSFVDEIYDPVVGILPYNPPNEDSVSADVVPNPIECEGRRDEGEVVDGLGVFDLGGGEIDDEPFDLNFEW